MGGAGLGRTVDAGGLDPYGAVLLLSFGGPDGPGEVMPFLRRVTAGKGVPEGRLAAVARHYHDRGGVSPINAENRALVAALEGELRGRGLSIPVVWGNRHSAPFTADALAEAHALGARRVVTVVTSAYPSYSGCRQYREDLARAGAAVASRGMAVAIDKVRPYADHPGFLDASAGLVTDAVRGLLAAGPARPHLVFVTHSIPVAMANSSGPDGHDYVRLHRRVAATAAAAASAGCGRRLDASLAFCSRSGPPSQPWLEPDVVDHLGELAANGVDAVALAPIGFVADHMEVVEDLDTQAAQRAHDLGMAWVRVPTVRDDSRFVAGLVDLLLERAAQARGELPDPVGQGAQRALPSVCVPGCCPNPRGPVPAACGAD